MMSFGRLWDGTLNNTIDASDEVTRAHGEGPPERVFVRPSTVLYAQ